MNPTHCEMKFLIHEQFIAFVEKFGNEKNEIDFKYFGIKDGDLLEGQFEDGSKTFIDIQNDAIRFVTKEPPYEFNFRMQYFGYDFNFSYMSDNGEGIRGCIEKHQYFVTHMFYPENEFENLVDYKESGEYEWNEKIRKLTLEKAKPNVTMRKLDGTFGIISEVSAHHPRINELVLTVPKITRTLPDPTERVLAHYTDIKSAVRDGWAIDLYDVEILNDLDPKE